MAGTSGGVVNLETPLPESISELRRKNEQIISNSKNDIIGRPDMSSIDLLVSEGHKGLAIRILEQWLMYNEGEEELKKVISLMDDRNSLQSAISWCEELLRLNPENQFALGKLLDLQVKNNDQSSAFRTASIMVRLNPDSVKGNEFLGHYFVSKEEWELAISHSQSCLSQDSKDSNSIRNLAISLEGMGDEEKAIEAWEKWSNSDPCNISDFELASDFFYSRERYSVVATISNRGLEIDQSNIALLESLILAYSSLQEWSLCLEATKKLLMLDRNNAIGMWNRKKSNFNLGITLGSQSNIDEGKRWYSLMEMDESQDHSIRWFNLV